MNYFSEVTQSTLSAFHKAGIDAVINEEIDLLRDTVRNKQKLIIKDIIRLPNNLVKRFFTNDTFDIVNKKDIFNIKYVYTQDNNVKIISETLSLEPSPISKLSLGKYRNKLTCERKKINRISEHVFFF